MADAVIAAFDVVARDHDTTFWQQVELEPADQAEHSGLETFSDEC
ncbi:MAG: hypothetical protein ACR2Q4_23715 [Geminicoccaceae bacterium]